MIEDKLYRMNTPAVTAESFAGEVVIINLQSGFYYSLLGTAAVVWDGLIAGASPETIVEEVSRRYGEPVENVRAPVARLVGELMDEQLIAVASDAEADSELRWAESIEGGTSFTDPVLQKFEDMEQLLLLDPIHEVDEAGWPVTKPEDR